MSARGAGAAPAFAALLRRFDRSLRRVRRNEDPGAIHDVRVCTRRLGTLLQVWRGTLERTSKRRMRRELRALRRELAEARDLQVLLPPLRARRAVEPVPNAALDVWVRELETDLANALVNAACRCDPRGLAKLRAALRQSAVALAGASRPAVRLDSRAVLARSQQRAARALRAAAAVRQVTGPAAQPLLHEARLRIKAWRYAEENVGSAQRARRAAGLQDGLGATHDLLVLRARASARNGLSGLARSLDDEAQRAWRDLRPGLVAVSRDAAAFVGARKGTRKAIRRAVLPDR